MWEFVLLPAFPPHSKTLLPSICPLFLKFFLSVFGPQWYAPLIKMLICGFLKEKFGNFCRSELLVHYNVFIGTKQHSFHAMLEVYKSLKCLESYSRYSWALSFCDKIRDYKLMLQSWSQRGMLVPPMALLIWLQPVATTFFFHFYYILLFLFTMCYLVKIRTR